MRLIIEDMARDLAQVPGVVGVLLGGSRARGAHRPESDWDLGVYYRGELDLAALRALAGPDVDVAAPGGWGLCRLTERAAVDGAGRGCGVGRG